MPHYKFDQIAFNITDKKMPEPGDEKMYIGLEHLDSGSLKITRWGSEVELTGQKLVMRKGDVLFGRRNTYLRRAAIAPHDGIFSAHGMIFRPKTQVIDPEYFPFFISSNYFMDAAIRISVGSLSPTVNWKTLKELEFDLPSLEEQRRNAALLKSINETKEAYQELLIQTDNLVKSQFIEMFGDCIRNDKEWNVRLLQDVLAEGCRVTYGIVKTEDDIPGGVPVFRPVDISQGHVPTRSELKRTSKEISDQYKRTILNGDELLITIRGSVGETFQISKEFEGCNVARNIVPLRANTEILLQGFLKAVIDSVAFQEKIASITKGVALKGININEFKVCPIILPPIEMQQQWVEFAQQSDKSKFELKEAIKSCDALMKAILFTNLEEKEG
ncbi:restriction endonuclease subunit S [Mogibacterium kristiansenii]|uniref:restriction endonuclease subunit S n=1 Tax=Mogibacterium kristiansenii TaxID=2606708 RepID=UPI00240A4FA6|nr:restriction endonuclease subunit S [Mogibacterium kristiansenii]MDD6699482.1 restriction endonuclease subunit S [Mogibacterium kristiansenii]